VSAAGSEIEALLALMRTLRDPERRLPLGSGAELCLHCALHH
jgi:hypothetical protein